MSGSNRDVRVGVIGVGRVAQRVHAPILASLPGVELAAIADPTADGKIAARRCSPACELFDSLEQLVANVEIDAAVIALPTHLHASAAESAFAAGLHVYVEKPIAASEADARRVLEAHRQADRIGMTGFNYRYHPLHRRARALVSSGAIGEIVAMRSVFATPARDLPAWKRSVRTGGGVLLDLFSHHADLARFHTGREINSVSARSRSVRSEGDNAAATVEFEGGISLQTTVSMSAAEMDRFEIIGSEGVLSIDRFANSLHHAPMRHSATTPEMTARAISRAWGSFGSLRPKMDPSYAPALAAFCAAVRSGEMAADDPTLEDGWRSLAAVLAAEASSSRDAVRVPVAREPAAGDRAPEIESSPTRAPANAAKPDGPLLSVCLVAVYEFESVRKVMGLLRKQTIAERLQVLLVVPSEDVLSGMTEADAEGLGELRPLIVGEITDVDLSSALVLPEAQAEYLAFLEDHAFPQPDWAERIVRAFETFGTAGIGTAIENGNPGSLLSWANMLMSYGAWVAAEHAGPTTNISRHNVAFRVDVLREQYGDDLPRMMGRDGGLLADLQSRGFAYAIEPATHVRHLNPSTWASTLELRINSGRLFASSRMKREKWSPAKRWLYVLGAPAIPVIRYRLLTRDLIGPGSDARRERIGAKAAPAIAIGCLLDGVGQFMGHLLGPGPAKGKLAFFEIGRARHLRRSEKHLMTDADA